MNEEARPRRRGRAGAPRRGEGGNVLVLFALLLPAFMAFAALAVDIGYLFYVRTAMQAAADAASMAGATGLGISQTEATSRAAAIGNLNIAQTPSLAGSTLNITFPSASTISVTVSNPAQALFFGPVIGWRTAAVSAAATAGVNSVSSIPSGGLVPFGLYCNNPADCSGVLTVGQTWTVRRYCGNFFVEGNSDACGNTISAGQVFLMGITFDESSNSNSLFRERVYSGYNIQINIGDIGSALPGNRNGWRDGMENRLLEGRPSMVFPVIRAVGTDRDIQVYDFVAVEVSNFTRVGNTDETTFTITQTSIATTDFATSSQGYSINSAVGIRLSQ